MLAHFAEELAAKLPQGHDWVIHFMNSGAEAVDLALLMARSYTGNIDFIALRNGQNVQAYLDEIDRTIDYATSGQLAGIMIEPIQGYGGILPMLPGYMEGAFERVRAAGGVCVVDR